MASVAETLKDFYIRLVPLVQKYVEANLISGTVENYNQLIESIELWDENGVQVSPEMYLEFRIKQKQQSLLMVSLDIAAPDDEDEFVVLGEPSLTRTSSSVGPRPPFGIESISEHLPKDPLVYRNLMRPEDVELRLVFEKLPPAGLLRKQTYEYPKLANARVRMLSERKIKETIKEYCDTKRMAQIKDTLRFRTSLAGETKEDIILLSTMLETQEPKKLDLDAMKLNSKVKLEVNPRSSYASNPFVAKKLTEFLETPTGYKALSEIDDHFTDKDGAAGNELRNAIQNVRNLLKNVELRQAEHSASDLGFSSFVDLSHQKPSPVSTSATSSQLVWFAVSDMDQDGMVEI